MLAFSIVVDIGFGYYFKVRTYAQIDHAVKAAVKMYDETALSQGTLAIDQVRAYHKFEQYLKLNLRLNDDFTPATGSLATGRVTIESFVVYNHASTDPFDTTRSLIIPAVHVMVRVPRSFIFATWFLPSLNVPFHVDGSLIPS